MSKCAACSCSNGALVVLAALRKRMLAVSIALFQRCVLWHEEANLDDAGESSGHKRMPEGRVDL